MAKAKETSVEKPPKIKATKLEQIILDAIKTAKLGLPDWNALAKQEHVTRDYIEARVDWMRRVGMIR